MSGAPPYGEQAGCRGSSNVDLRVVANVAGVDGSDAERSNSAVENLRRWFANALAFRNQYDVEQRPELQPVEDRFLDRNQAASLTVLEAALAAAETALRAEHPTIDDVPFDPEHDIVPSLLTAHLILSRAAELRDLLHLYSAAVRRALRVDFDPDEGLF